jgi:hypothetical protein
MALGSTQPLTEMSTRNLLSRKCGNLGVSQASGPSRPGTGIAFTYMPAPVEHIECLKRALRIRKSSSSSIGLSCDRSIASSKVLERDYPGKVVMW